MSVSEPCVHAYIVAGGNSVWYCAACRRTFLPSGDSSIAQEVVKLRAMVERMQKIIEDYAEHGRNACRDVPEAEAKSGFCHCGLSAALKEAGL